MRINRKILKTAAVAASAAWLGGCFLGGEEGPSAEQKKQSTDAAAQGTG